MAAPDTGKLYGRSIRAMFRSIATRYDITNTILSVGIHHLWKRFAVRTACIKAGDRALDLCCGTGDLSFRLARDVGPQGMVIAVDFTPEMLFLGQKKLASTTPRSQVTFILGDALSLPLRSGACDVATIAFGIRNIAEPLTALEEVRRVLRPGGKLIVLEFGVPTESLGGELYKFYAKYLLPLIGGFLTGNRGAYTYLHETACGYLTGEEFLELLRHAGFSELRWQPLLWGIAHLYTGIGVHTGCDQ